jgi:hypothetical protein
MTYGYKIYDFLDSNATISEIINNKFKNWTFNLSELIKSHKHFVSNEHRKCYERTRKWMIENYPELLI